MTDEPIPASTPPASTPPASTALPVNGPSCTVFSDADRLDALADVIAEEAEPEVVGHIADCPVCTPALAELQAALPAVASALAGLSDVPAPAGLPARLSAALAAEAAGTDTNNTATVLPLLPDLRRSWLPWAGGLAAAAVLIVGGLVLAGRSASTQATTASSAAAPTVAGPVLNDTGTDYGRDGKALAAAVPSLLAGTGGTATSPESLAKGAPAPVASAPVGSTPSVGADPLARLRTIDGLASCLASLTTPDVPGTPLAVDYAAFGGQPALVVLLPSTRTGKVDVFVLGADCSARDAKVLFFSRVTR